MPKKTLMKCIINYCKNRLNTSTIIAIVIICMFIPHYTEIINEVLVLSKWFISDQMKVLLSDKSVVIAITTTVIALLHKK